MKKVVLLATVVCLASNVFCVATSAALFAGEGDVSSLCDEVLAKMRNSRRDVHGDSSWARWLFVNLGSDSNRVCQVAEGVYARSANKMDQEDALLLINRYGSLNQRPFIESCVTNVACGRYAMRVLTKVEGVTSNSVVQLDRFRSSMADESQANEFAVDRAGAVSDLLFAASKIDNLPLRNHIGAYAWSCLSTETNQVATIDSMLAFCDSSYKWSRRRLNVLRQAYAQTTIEAMRACLNARIQQLESYPEANLPE